jgi:signal transduction histidine kinase
VAAGRGALHQVRLNLFHNAARHARGASGSDLRVGRGSDHSVVFTVADDGEGIPPEAQARIFEPFHSGAGGTGLGLVITRRLVTEQHGRIVVSSTPGEDATFSVTLPTT